MTSSSDGDFMPVTVWFVKPAETKFKDSLKSTMVRHRYTIDEELIVDNLSQLKDDSFKSLKDYQGFSKLYRESRKSVFYKHNREMMNTLNKRYSIEPSIIYYSKYTPFVILSITKEDLLKIQYDENISLIFFHEDDVAIEERSDEESISSINDMGSTVNTLDVAVSSGDVTHNKEIFATVNWIQDVTCTGSPPYVNPYVLPGYHHELRLYDPQGNLVARSNYIYDRKQFIRYKPTQAGTYTLSVHKTGFPAYYPQAAIAYGKYRPIESS